MAEEHVQRRLAAWLPMLSVMDVVAAISNAVDRYTRERGSSTDLGDRLIHGLAEVYAVTDTGLNPVARPCKAFDSCKNC